MSRENRQVGEATRDARDHYYSIDVFVPSDVDVSDDRLRWYFDHAVRGYHRGFALDTDPIRGMGRCSLRIKQVPFRAQPLIPASDLEQVSRERDEAVRLLRRIVEIENDNGMGVIGWGQVIDQAEAFLNNPGQPQ